jgi:hypothetical protein
MYYNASEAEVPPTAFVEVSREDRMWNLLARYDIHINGTRVAQLDRGEVRRIRVAPGVNQIMACVQERWRSQPLEFSVAAGATRRLLVRMNTPRVFFIFISLDFGSDRYLRVEDLG